MGKQIKDFPQKSVRGSSDLLLIQDGSSEAYMNMQAADFLSGLASGGGGGLAAWQLKSSDYTAFTGDRIQADTTNAWGLTLPSSGEIELIKIKGSNALSIYLNSSLYQTNSIPGVLKLNINFEKVGLIYIDSNTGWIADRQSLLSFEALPVRYWRVTNKDAATGTISDIHQWIVRELIFKDASGADITSGGTPINAHEPNTAANAFDKNNGTFTTVSRNTDSPYGSIEYVFANSVSVKSISISNLNNGYNIPPTSYSVDSSVDGNTWSTVWNFRIGTNDGTFYDSALS